MVFHRSAFLTSLVLIHGAMVGYCTWMFSPTYDEPAHLAAGLEHWERGTFRLYRVNPPLVRLVATSIVQFLPHEARWKQWEQVKSDRPEFSVGDQFLEANKAQIRWLFLVARMSCLSLSIIGLLSLHWLAQSMYGRFAATVAAMCWAFSPTIIGNAALITPDLGGAVFGVILITTLRRWWIQPSIQNLILTAIALGLCLAAKGTWLFLYLVMPLLISVRLLTCREYVFRSMAQTTSHVFVIVIIPLFVLATFYGGAGMFVPLKSFSFQSSLLRGHESISERWGNRFTGSLIGEVPVPLPADFVLGIDTQKKEFEARKPAYLFGRMKQDGGWCHYYIAACLVKLPLGLLGLLILSVLRMRRLSSDEWMIYGVALFLLVNLSLQTGINKHFRYLLPVFPMIVLFACRGVARSARVLRSGMGMGRKYPSTVVIAIMLATAVAIESLWTYPHSLSFFNSAAGGPSEGYRYLANSNISWGQDLWRLRDWQRHQAPETTFQAALHCGYDPALLGIRAMTPATGIVPFDSIRTAPDPVGQTTIPPGLYAVDVNYLVGYPYGMAAGRVHGYPKTEFWQQFMKIEPIDRVGYTIRVYVIQNSYARADRETNGRSTGVPSD